MKTKYSLLALLLCAWLVGGLTWAEDKVGPTWLSKDEQAALLATVPAPPAPNSDVDKADLATLLQQQAARAKDEAMLKECNTDKTFGIALFQPVFGANLTAENSPKFYALMKQVLHTTGAVNGAAKDKFKRLRPYQAHPDEVHALWPVEGFSYPSGHSMGSYTLANVLGTIFPDKAQAFLDRAKLIAQSRVDAGVHNPSDIAEGETLGKATAAAILANAAFKQDLAGVQAELKK